MLHEERDGVIASLSQIMADWTDREIVSFADCLRRLNTDIERLSGQPWLPRP